MKNRLLFLSTLMAVMLLSACSAPKYYFYQLYQAKPAENDEQFAEEEGRLVYENNKCIIYYNFWEDKGNTDFTIYNKTDQMMTIDLGQSFFTLNGIAYDLFQNRSYSQNYTSGSGTSIASSLSYSYPVGVNNSQATLFSYGNSYSLTSFQAKTTEQTTNEKQMILIPPYYAKRINSYPIVVSPLLMCDLERYPESSSQPLYFTPTTSPIIFSIYLTYQIGSHSDWENINNQFYVDVLTNYAEPAIADYMERKEPCENMKDLTYQSSSVVLYDKYLKKNVCVQASSFYVWYGVGSYKKLYQQNRNYYYSNLYDAYISSGTQNRR